MSYQSLGLAGLIVSAIRAAVADPALQAEVHEATAANAEQAAQIAAVQEGFTAIGDRLTALEADDTLNDDARDTVAGLRAELADIATALTGPVDDETDNGVIGEVQPVDGVEPSPSADDAVDALPDE